MSTRVLSNGLAVPIPSEDLPLNHRPHLPPASLRVYCTAEAERVFAWWTPSTSEARLQRLAQEIIRITVGSSSPLAIVYAPDGALFGVVPVAGELYGFTLPELGPRANNADYTGASYRAALLAAAELGTDAGRAAYRFSVFQLAARLASLGSAEELTGVLLAFRPRPQPPEVALLNVTNAPVVGTPAKNLQTIVGRLLNTYRDFSCERIQAPGRVRPPQQAEVERLADGLLALLFPGYRGPLAAAPGFDSFVCRQVSSLQALSVRLVRRALAFRDSVAVPDAYLANTYRAAAHRAIVTFFDALPELRRTLNADAEAAYENDPALEKWDHHSVPLAYPGLYATAIHRIAHQFHLLEVPYLPRMLSELAHSKTGIDIHPAAKIGGGFFIDHGTGVVIGETAVIGEKVTLYQGVTLGALNFERDDEGQLVRGNKRHPTLHSRTTVYANAAVLGDIEVGHTTRIGANVSLRQSVPAESVVRIPFSFRELSISSPRLALEDPSKPADVPTAPAQRETDPELGLPTDFDWVVDRSAHGEVPIEYRRAARREPFASAGQFVDDAS